MPHLLNTYNTDTFWWLLSIVLVKMKLILRPVFFRGHGGRRGSSGHWEGHVVELWWVENQHAPSGSSHPLGIRSAAPRSGLLQGKCRSHGLPLSSGLIIFTFSTLQGALGYITRSQANVSAAFLHSQETRASFLTQNAHFPSYTAKSLLFRIPNLERKWPEALFWQNTGK